jgi:hypothetical protein
MKKTLGILSVFFLGLFCMGATTNQVYLHHEMPSLASLEADLQNREIGIDPVNRSAVGKFSDGTKFHLVAQEMPNVSLTGNLGVTGAITASNNLTLSLLPTGRIPYTTTGGLITSASTFTYNGTTFATNSGTYSGPLGVTGVTSATGGLTLGARFIDKTTSLTSNTTLSSVHSVIFAAATGGSFVITLPAASGNAGLVYNIFKTDASANTVTVDGNASETIGGALTVILGGNTGNSRLVILCDGTNWQVRELYEEGTYTATLTGCTTAPTGTFSWTKNGNIVTIRPAVNFNATSNSTALTFTGAPSAIYSPSSVRTTGAGTIMDNGGTALAVAQMGITGTLSMVIYSTLSNASAAGFTSSGAKGTSTIASVFVYAL